MSIGLGCQGFGEQCLACAGRTVEQNAFGGLYTQTLEELRMLHGKLDHLSDLLDLCREASDVLVGDPRSGFLYFFFGWFIRDIDLGPVANHCCFFGGRHAGGHELNLAAHDRDLNDVSPCDDTAFHVSLQVLLSAGDTQRNRRREDHRFRHSGLRNF